MQQTSATRRHQGALITPEISARLAAVRAGLGTLFLITLILTVAGPTRPLAIAGLATATTLAGWTAWIGWRGHDTKTWVVPVESGSVVIGIGAVGEVELAAIAIAALLMVPLAALGAGAERARTTGAAIVLSTLFMAVGHEMEPIIVVALLVGQGGLITMLMLGLHRAVIPLERSLRDLDDLSSNVPAVIWESDPRTGGVLSLRGQIEELTGEPLDEDGHFHSELFRSWIHPDDVDRVWIPPSEVHLNMAPIVRTYRVIRPDGSERHVRDTVRAALNTDNQLRLRGLMVDVSELVRRELRVEQLASLVERSTDAVIIAERRTGHAELWNDSARAYFAGDQIARTVGEFLERHPELLSADDGHVIETFTDDALTVETARVECQDLADGRIGLRFTDSTESTREITRLADRADTDELTGLANRRRFTAALRQRLDENRPTALFIIDLDRFKQINDSLGHTAGDQVLTITTTRLLERCRDTDLVARLGGDEFAVLADTDSETGAMELGQRFAEMADERFSINGIQVRCGLSVGLATSPEDGERDDLLISRADAAMYDAKSSGGGFRRFRPEQHHDPAAQARLVAELPEASDRGDLIAYWQPQHDLHTGALVGAEALVRWDHPDFGLLTPDRFIEAAELADSIAVVSRTMLRQAGLVLSQGLVANASVNISARDLHRPELLDEVTTVFERFGVPAGSLTLEVTETSHLSDGRAAREALVQLRTLGARISLDDVGTGHSSFKRLAQLPVDELKIDRSFVSTLSMPTSRAVVRAVIHVAEDLGLHVVGEGVEDAETAELLAELGCTTAQGYHFARPLTPANFEQYVAGATSSRVRR